jgi:hypothetical protein
MAREPLVSPFGSACEPGSRITRCAKVGADILPVSFRKSGTRANMIGQLLEVEQWRGLLSALFRVLPLPRLRLLLHAPSRQSKRQLLQSLLDRHADATALVPAASSSSSSGALVGDAAPALRRRWLRKAQRRGQRMLRRKLLSQKIKLAFRACAADATLTVDALFLSVQQMLPDVDLSTPAASAFYEQLFVKRLRELRRKRPKRRLRPAIAFRPGQGNPLAESREQRAMTYEDALSHMNT